MREWDERGMWRGRSEGKEELREKGNWFCELQGWLWESGAVRECPREHCVGVRLEQATVIGRNTSVLGLCEISVLGSDSGGECGGELL